MLKQLINLTLVITSPALFMIAVVTIGLIINIIKEVKKGKRIKRSTSTYKKTKWITKLFIQFPRRLALDIINNDPDDFKETGLHLFCGEQGAGKTCAVVELLLRLKEKYPRVKIRTNMEYKYEDGKIEHWQELIENDNGKYGQIEVIDEIQSWFSSMESKDFPPDMLTEISQQRKQRKMLVGTAQIYGRIAKPIREQATIIYLPMTIFGCLTIVRKTKKQYWDENNQTFKRYIGTYFFVHTDKIRDAFDTYKKIQRYKKKGFKVPEWRKEA